MSRKLGCYLLLSMLFYTGFILKAHAEGGKLLAKFPESIHFFVKDKKSGLIYATTRDDILIIDPVALTIDR
jgi:hypothetical protein